MRRARALGSAGPSPRLLLVVLAVLAALVAGCAPRPIPVTMPTPTGSPTSAAPEVTAAEECDNPTQSYDPLPAADMQSFRVMMDPAVIRIVARGELVVGVSADTPLLGSLNPTTGVFEGFDIDLAHYLAERMLGDPDKVRFVVVSAGERFSTWKRGTSISWSDRRRSRAGGGRSSGSAPSTCRPGRRSCCRATRTGPRRTSRSRTSSGNGSAPRGAPPAWRRSPDTGG